MLRRAVRGELVSVKQRKRSPLVSSVNAIRALAAGITMLSLASMTVYAGDHLYNQGAPLQPAASAGATAATTTTSTTGRLQLSRTVTTTTTRAVTTTHHS